MSPVELFSLLPFSDTRFNAISQSSVQKNRPLKWSEARRFALHRDRLCRRCSSDTPLTVHHIWPRGLGGGHDIENLITLCEPCHQHLCSTCSRAESARVPGWVKPDLLHQPAGKYGYTTEIQEDKAIAAGLSGIYPDTSQSLVIYFPKKLRLFWELTEPERIAEEKE